MGLFISHCPNCNANISWFLETPTDYVCNKCNQPVSAEAIEESYRELHRKRMEEFDRINYLNSIPLSHLAHPEIERRVLNYQETIKIQTELIKAQHDFILYLRKKETKPPTE